jgi:predicted RNA-binding protein with PUA-like domain
MAYWLMKSEPAAWSWDDQVKSGADTWDGVRSHQACNNMKAMRLGDLCFFYHSITEKAVVGIVKVVKEYYPDHTDETGRFGMVDVEPVKPLEIAVTLQQIKAEPELSELALVRQSRLSVLPVDDRSWNIICEMGGVSP